MAMEQPSPQPRTPFPVGNPLHAGLQLLTDILSRVPGPHQRRISSRQPADDASLAQALTSDLSPPSLSALHSGHGTGQPAERVVERREQLSLPTVHGYVATLHAGGPVTREELGRATWTLLHTLAAQFPENPTRQQRKDATQLVGSWPAETSVQHALTPY